MLGSFLSLTVPTVTRTYSFFPGRERPKNRWNFKICPEHMCFFWTKSAIEVFWANFCILVHNYAYLAQKTCFRTIAGKKFFFDFYWFLTTGGTKLKKIENFYFSLFCRKHVPRGFQHPKTRFRWFKSVKNNARISIWSNFGKIRKNRVSDEKWSKTQNFSI